MLTPACPYCGEGAELVEAEAVGIHGFGDRVWYCQRDKAWAAIHPNSPTSKPMTRLSKAELHTMRKRAASAFTRLYKTWGATRREAYQWLADQIDVELADCDFDKFGMKECMDAHHLVITFTPIFGDKNEAAHAR